VSVTVNAVPAAQNDSYATGKAPSSLPAPGVLGNDTDRDPADTLRVLRSTASARRSEPRSRCRRALLRLHANGSLDYDPNGQFAGLTFGQQATDSFTYTTSDGRGGAPRQP
jgi:hypothetical protein